MPGLYLVVQPSGAKSWAVRYRHAGSPRKLTLGGFPAVKLPDARKRAGAALRAVAEGRDPAREKQEKRRQEELTDDSVSAVVDLFLARYVRPKNRSAEEVERLLQREVVEPWQKRTIHQIARRHVVELLDAIVDRGSPYTANRVFAQFRSSAIGPSSAA